MTVSLPAIAVLGAGSMGSSIVHGLLDGGATVSGGIRVTNRTEAKAAMLRMPGVASLALETDPNANHSALEGAKLVLIAVKPFMVADLLDEIAPSLDSDAIVVSVAAGLTLDTLQAHLPAGVAAVRAVPNTPVGVRLGVTCVAASDTTTPEQLALVVDLFEAIGEAVVMPEDQVDAGTALAGSGPAYVFYFIEKLVDVAREAGFSGADAATLVEGTFRGSIELLSRSEHSAEELRRRVTSPGGTTAEAIRVFDEAKLGEVFADAIQANMARSQQMAADAAAKAADNAS